MNLTLMCMIQGHIFIDRDPKHFALILNFLRDGFAVLPRDEQALTEIMVEAAFYKVQSSPRCRPPTVEQCLAGACNQGMSALRTVWRPKSDRQADG